MEPGPLVLVIDDELHARELMTRHLWKAGFQVALAADGREGLALAKQLNPVAITLDVLMPKMDGWEVLQALKQDPDLAEIPVIMCTVLDDAQHGFSLGAAEFLTKPVDPKRLQKILNRFCPSGDCNVLLVEDDTVQRRLISRELQSGGWQVFEAEHGIAALGLLREKAIGVILLDLMMPEMNGFEFVEAMQKDPDLRKVPIVVLTGKDLSSAERSRLNGYVDTILAKGDQGLQGVIRDIRRVLRHKVTMME
jgi:CheY-like chemotaxis protein